MLIYSRLFLINPALRTDSFFHSLSITLKDYLIMQLSRLPYNVFNVVAAGETVLVNRCFK